MLSKPSCLHERYPIWFLRSAGMEGWASRIQECGFVMLVSSVCPIFLVGWLKSTFPCVIEVVCNVLADVAENVIAECWLCTDASSPQYADSCGDCCYWRFNAISCILCAQTTWLSHPQTMSCSQRVKNGRSCPSTMGAPRTCHCFHSLSEVYDFHSGHLASKSPAPPDDELHQYCLHAVRLWSERAVTPSFTDLLIAYAEVSWMKIRTRDSRKNFFNISNWSTE